MGAQGWNMKIANPTVMINGAHLICDSYNSGATVDQMRDDIMRGPDKVTPQHAAAFILTAIDIYCPPTAPSSTTPQR
jgi:uncharacterized protein DUF732